MRPLLKRNLCFWLQKGSHHSTKGISSYNKRDLIIHQKGSHHSTKSSVSVGCFLHVSRRKNNLSSTWRLLWMLLCRSELPHRLTSLYRPVTADVIYRTDSKYKSFTHQNTEIFSFKEKKKTLICWEWVEKVSSTLMSLNMKLQSGDGLAQIKAWHQLASAQR